MNLRHRCPNAASARQTLIAGALALFLFVLTEPAQSAQVVLWFVNPWTAQNDTNAFVAQGISTNILANGGVQAVGLPVRIQPSQTTGLATNYFGLGWYSVKDAAVNGQYVINVYDSGSSLYYYTNLLQSGFNTYVVVTYGSNPPPSYNAITNALGYVPDATNAALNATNPIPAWISATNTASLVISTGLVQNATNPIPGWISYSNTANLIITTGLVQNATSTIPALVTASTNPIPGWITAATNPITGWISATNLANLITTTGLVQNATSSIPASITAATNPVPTWITAATNPVAGWISASSTSNLTAQTTASNANYWLTIYTLSQVGKYTNSIQVTGGSGTYSSCNGILDWCGGNGWTNSTAATVSLTNDVNGSRFIISGVSVAGAIGGWPVGSAFTNISGSGTLPATTFFTNQDVAGANLSIANVRGTKTFTAAGSGSATNVNFLSSSNVTAATVSSTNLFYVPAGTFDSAGAAQGATNALQQEITNSLYTSGGAVLNSNNINGRIQNANAPFDISTSTNANASKINGTALGGLGTGILKNTTGTGVPSIASAGTDYQAALTSSQIITVNNAPTNASGTNATVFSVGAGTVFGPTNYYWPGDQRVVTNNQVNFPVKSIALSTEITDGSGNELIDTSGNLYYISSTLASVLPQALKLDDQNGTVSVDWKNRLLNGAWTETNVTATGTFSGVGSGLTSLNGTAIANAGGAMVATLASGGVNFTNGAGQISKAGPYTGPTWSGLSFYGTNSTSGNNVTSLADLIGGGSGSTPGFYLNYGIFSGNGSSLTFLNASNMAAGNSSSSNVWNGKFVGDISSATNISAALNNLATPSILTNAIGVMENAIYYTTNSIIGSVGFGSSSNNVLYFPVASNAWASAFGTWIFPDSALNFLMINPDGTTNYSRGGSPIGTGWTVKGGIAPGGTTYWTNFPLSISLSNQMVTIAQLYGGAGGAAPTNLVNNGSLAGVISTAGGTNFIGTNVAPNTLNMLAGNNAGGAADSGIAVASIVSNQVPVEYFGATGGSHDDTAAFQLALNSGKNIILNGATNYTIGNVWASNRNVYLDGAGATVYFLSTASNYMVVCTNLSTTNLTIKNVVSKRQQGRIQRLRQPLDCCQRDQHADLGLLE